MTSSGDSQLDYGNWRWKSRPHLDGSEGSFDVVTARVGVRLKWNTPFPSVFARGRKLAQADFPGVRIPAGDFWCLGPRETGVVNEHDEPEIRWMGIKAEDVLSPADLDLVISGGDSAVGKFALLDMTEEMGHVALQLPITDAVGGVVYADAAFLPPGAPAVNPYTGEYQATTLYLEAWRRNYSGVAIGSGSAHLPSLIRCTALARDIDGASVNLTAANAPAGQVRVRRAVWWPRRDNFDSTGWRFSGFSFGASRRLGGGVYAKTWRAEFVYSPMWTLVDG